MQAVHRPAAAGRALSQMGQIYPELTAPRRDLHAHPELGFGKTSTGVRVKEALKMCSGTTAELGYERIVPSTINREATAKSADGVAQDWVITKNAGRQTEACIGLHAFSFMLQTKPGAFTRQRQVGVPNAAALHNSRYDFNDDILTLGAALHASLIERAMPLPAA